jgi:O-acetyl-ADP-ribose deacetylase (regulator of RNase III)
VATYLGGRVGLIRADITTLDVDAIVNAANSSLLGGGGVDGGIHRAAGPDLLAECRRLNGAEPGDAKLTGGYRLPARHVIHAVGPIWRGGGDGENEVLASAYRRSLEVAEAAGLASVAFPSISTGAYGFPIKLATPIAHATIREWLLDHGLPRRVVFCVFSEGDLRIHEAIAAEVFGPQD